MKPTQNNARRIINGWFAKANSQFNPSLNQRVEDWTGEPSDRDSYDYAGTEQEIKQEHD